MISQRTRLDRFLSITTGVNRRSVRGILAQGRVSVDGVVARDIQQVVHQFSVIIFDDKVLQQNQSLYFMMNKPPGVVSATKDKRHKTVLDLVKKSDGVNLHIAGRLDFNSSGLLLLTNDGAWSRHLSSPEQGIKKYYRVALENKMTEEYVQAFRDGIYFEYEGITTQSAELTIIDDRIAEISVTEGRYHQIKRMFGRYQNKVLSLHRYRIGDLELDSALEAGQYRALSNKEVATIGGH
ncbi:MAG: 16S rRNA pseudouridine(516) synthase [Pseudomonadales bacterium]|nr:16S rRNA pseudouridine(516) synthase [Pseudomonadales bacterium]